MGRKQQKRTQKGKRSHTQASSVHGDEQSTQRETGHGSPHPSTTTPTIIPGIPHYEGQEIKPKKARYGPKDFQPDPMDSTQEYRLDATMREFTLLHKCERVLKLKRMSMAVWRPECGLAQVILAKGTHPQTMGQFHREYRSDMLYPEEALFLVDRGVLEMYHNDAPLSFQEAMALCLSTSSSLRAYIVYAHLKRLGYIVLRRSHCNAQMRALQSPLHTRGQQRQQPGSGDGVTGRRGEGGEDTQRLEHGGDGDEDASANGQSQHQTTEQAQSLVGRAASFVLSLVDKVVSPVAAAVSPHWSSPPPLAHTVDGLDFPEMLRRQRVIKQERLIPPEHTQADLDKEEVVYKDDLPDYFAHAFNVYTASKRFKRGNVGVPKFVVVPISHDAPRPSLKELRAMSAAVAPAALKFAVEKCGTILFHGLLDLDLPVYTVTRSHPKHAQKQEAAQPADGDDG
ncbi:hypothetical protein PTSG_09463 [Salpingoeca rosetta]|uniref:tRNA-splicing endonuclease subunit Sen54 N-terminal domain-containing protein n=1 Tax=Salpingoeca rosetta (strain ATCC 50818 / BSB-021) TaxID=946362 RepID=F2UMP6_SALR5|nr:uncharacterized protein PTSG_09463 [Salpingoeca rosetta]EGD78395.1 hypothetical protein PTSG_09463 [Salpingoeca rosetta]|eukprot:XP_004989718.1 hypothetical protein PTSG_09463 [Salpingoeca rosetta]